MSEPTPLRADYNTGMVSMLTELIRRAKAGEISQIAMVAIEPVGDRYSTWISDRGPGADHSTLKLIGAVADLQWTLLQVHNEQQP